MSKKKKKQEKKSKTIQRVVTLVLGLGFAASTLAIALASVFSQNNTTASHSEVSTDSPTAEEQMQMQISGYEKVLAREPQNITALEGLTQIYLLTGNRPKAASTLEKLVKHYPKEQKYTDALKSVKQEAKPPEATSNKPEVKNKVE